MNWQGAWSGLTTYAVNDAVFYSGSSYRSLTGSNLNNQPDLSPASWALFASGGGSGNATLTFGGSLSGTTTGAIGYTFQASGASVSATARTVGVLGRAAGGLSGSIPLGSAVDSNVGLTTNFTMGVMGNTNAGNVGVLGLAGSQTSVGVWGHNDSNGGTNWNVGVIGTSNGTNAGASGVYGQGNVGVRGRSLSSTGFGVRGENTNTGGGVGVYASTAAGSGRSIFALGSVFVENRSAQGSSTSGSDGLIVWSNAGASGFNSSGALFTPSDRNSKKNFTELDTADVLAKVVAMPVTRWNYKNDDSTWYMGPMAQDFRAAFGLGDKDTVIHQVNADGVALAAIQGLNAKLESELKRRDAALVALSARIESLESSRSTAMASGAIGAVLLGGPAVALGLFVAARRRDRKGGPSAR